MVKNVALFFDGTWMRHETNGDSNVFRLYRMAESVPGSRQVCHYISGVGTNRIRFREVNDLRRRARIGEESSSTLGRYVRKYVGGCTGYGIDTKIQEAYAFLVQNYDHVAGDRVYLFGFSRGAFAARSLAAFINEIGLLLRNRIYLVPEAYEIYRMRRGKEVLARFLERRLGHRVSLGESPIPVYLVGVWDTVGALDFPPPFDGLSFNTSHHQTLALPSNVTHARHALALHELRELYQPSPWMKSADHQSLFQVWFAGAHADVGGGNPASGLSDISLLWMAKQAGRLHLDLDYAKVKTAPDPNCDIHLELGFLHSAFDFRCRDVLHQLMQDHSEEATRTHAVDPTVIQKILLSRSRGSTYPYRKRINDQLEKADDIVLELAIRLTLRSESLPDPEEPNSFDMYKQSFVELLLDPAPEYPSRIKNLTNSIALVMFDKGIAGVTTLEDAIDECLAEILATPQDGADRNALVMDWLKNTIADLKKVSDELCEGAVKTYLSLLVLRHELTLIFASNPVKKPRKKQKL